MNPCVSRALILAFSIVILARATAGAQPMFVRDWIVVTVRSAPQESAGQVGQASTGERVDVLEVMNDWSRIRLGSGVEGWTQSRFLSPSPPAALRVRQLEERIRVLQAQLAAAGRAPAAPEAMPPVAQYDTTAAMTYGPEDAASLKTGYDRLKAEHKACIEARDAMGAEISRLKNSERLFFTFIGGLFIVLGVLIGIFIQLAGPRSKKQGYRF
jgi:SH3 domain protein